MVCSLQDGDNDYECKCTEKFTGKNCTEIFGELVTLVTVSVMSIIAYL